MKGIVCKMCGFISIDGDRSDNVRIVRKAAEEDDICGRFFISEPDFEFQNFTLDELEEILWKVCEDRGAPDSIRKNLHIATLAPEGNCFWRKGIPKSR